MSRRLIITSEAYAALRDAAILPLDEKGCRPQPDGSVSIPLADDTVARLRQRQLVGESMSETILRVVAIAGRGLN